MSSPTGSDAVCYPTRIVSGAIHRMDRERALYAQGKKNEWDVLLGAFRRYLRGTGTAEDHFHFTEAPGMCPVATPVDFRQVCAIAYQCGLPVRDEPTAEVDVVQIHLTEDDWMFFLAERDQAEVLEQAWRDHAEGAEQEQLAWGATVHTGNLLRVTWLMLAFDRIKDLVRAPLPDPSRASA